MKIKRVIMCGMLVSLFVACCVFVGLRVNALQEENAPVSDASASKDNSYASLPDKTITLDGKPVSDIGGRKIYNPYVGGDICYHNLPEIMEIEPGQYFTIPNKTDKLKDIVGWAETNLTMRPLRFMSVVSNSEIISGQHGVGCFVVLYDVGSGVIVWKYLVYVQSPARQWQLLCLGPVSAAGKLIDYPYIDAKKGQLIFGTREGEIIKAVDIASPLKKLQKQGWINQK